MTFSYSVPRVALILLLISARLQKVVPFAAQNFGSSPKKKKAAEKKKQGYLYRSTGIKTKRRKPPKWEKEGVRSKSWMPFSIIFNTKISI